MSHCSLPVSGTQVLVELISAELSFAFCFHFSSLWGLMSPSGFEKKCLEDEGVCAKSHPSFKMEVRVVFVQGVAPEGQFCNSITP